VILNAIHTKSFANISSKSMLRLDLEFIQGFLHVILDHQYFLC